MQLNDAADTEGGGGDDDGEDEDGNRRGAPGPWKMATATREDSDEEEAPPAPEISSAPPPSASANANAPSAYVPPHLRNSSGGPAPASSQSGNFMYIKACLKTSLIFFHPNLFLYILQSHLK